jgi:hypothetical protein
MEEQTLREGSHVYGHEVWITSKSLPGRGMRWVSILIWRQVRDTNTYPDQGRGIRKLIPMAREGALCSVPCERR